MKVLLKSRDDIIKVNSVASCDPPISVKKEITPYYCVNITFLHNGSFIQGTCKVNKFELNEILYGTNDIAEKFAIDIDYTNGEMC